MANTNKTPLIRPLRKEGGTLYVFPSATEDIGLNINSRANRVALSYYALLELPECANYNDIIEYQTANQENSDTLNKNYFQPGLIGGRFTAKADTVNYRSNNIGAWEIAASLQNYVMNFETLLRNIDTYNYQLYKTVSERVFWKWLKETGAIRWEYVKDENGYATGYFREISDSANYNRVVKCFGEISSGNSLSTEFGMFNETYITIPSSYGESPIYFFIDEDPNYVLGNTYTSNELNIGALEGRSEYISNNIEDFQYTINTSWGDVLNTASDSAGDNALGTIYVEDSGASAQPWYKYLYKTDITSPAYITDDKVLQNMNEDGSYDSLDNNMVVTLPGSHPANTISDSSASFIYKRSKLDSMALVKTLSEYKEIIKTQIPKYENDTHGEFCGEMYSDYALADVVDLADWDKLAINFHKNLSSKFKFNAVLLYYTVYDSANNSALATNLFGILFLDGINESLDTASTEFTGSNMEFSLRPIEKRQSNEQGFGTGYSFRVNIKTSSIYDNTDALISDNTTANSIITDNFNDVIHSLRNTIYLMQGNIFVTQNIANQYNSIQTQLQSNEFKIESLQQELNSYLHHKYINIVAEAMDTDVLAARRITSVADSNLGDIGLADQTSIDFVFFKQDPSNPDEHTYADPIMSINKWRTAANVLDASIFSSEENWQVIKLDDLAVTRKPTPQTNMEFLEALNVEIVSKPWITKTWNYDTNSYEIDYHLDEDSSTVLEYVINPNSDMFINNSPYAKALFKSNENNEIAYLDNTARLINYQKMIPFIISCLQTLSTNYGNVSKLSKKTIEVTSNATETIVNNTVQPWITEIEKASEKFSTMSNSLEKYNNTIEQTQDAIFTEAAAEVVTRLINDNTLNISTAVEQAVTTRMDEITNAAQTTTIQNMQSQLTALQEQLNTYQSSIASVTSQNYENLETSYRDLNTSYNSLLNVLARAELPTAIEAEINDIIANRQEPSEEATQHRI